jgi:hypothetical protein
MMSLKENLQIIETEFEQVDDIVKLIENEISEIDIWVEKNTKEEKAMPVRKSLSTSNNEQNKEVKERSIFDDIDK